MKFSTVNDIRYLSFDIFPGYVKQAIFTRSGGMSPTPWNSLNVGSLVGDDLANVTNNKRRLFEALSIDDRSMFDVWQVHSSDIVIANQPHQQSSFPPEYKADGIVTDQPGVTLFMRFADCTPIMLCDPKKKAIGIVHAGWQGTVKKAALQAVKTFQAAFGTDPGDILAAIGPAIGPDHYEVGENVIEQVKHAFGAQSDQVLMDHNGKIHFNLWEANKISLNEAGVTSVEVAGICTACNTADWFSHRAEKGKTGRFGALISILP